MITTEIIKDLNPQEIKYESGPLSNVVIQVTVPERAIASSLVFVSTLEQATALSHTPPAAVIAHSKLNAVFPSSTCVFRSHNIPLAMATVLPLFDGKMNRFRQEERIHPTAEIHPSAHIGKNTLVGPHVIIGEHAWIGDECTIGANTVIENSSRIGSFTIVHPQVYIGSHCEMGSHCEIHPHTTIGSDGYGYATDKHGIHHKIPQLGKVVIHDRVEIGANVAIDRATLTETVIGEGTKIDNLCHIAHNVKIGRGCFLTAGFMVAGSSTLGDYVVCGGNTVVADHVNISNHVTLAGASVVLSDIPEEGQYGGHPLVPMRDYLRSLAQLKKLSASMAELRQQISTINTANATKKENPHAN